MTVAVVTGLLEKSLRGSDSVVQRKNELLKEIEECNLRLERFFRKSQDTLPTTISWKGKLGAHHHFIRDFACNLHSALSRSWLCDCEKPHGARLQLENRNSKDYDPDSSVCFRVVFANEAIEAEIRIPPKKRCADLAAS
jgi:hypothetical protein